MSEWFSMGSQNSMRNQNNVNKSAAQAISQMVFELTITSSLTPDLDKLLERLTEILAADDDFFIQKKAAMVLLNPRGHYFQVAQTGMSAAWDGGLTWTEGIFSDSKVLHTSRVEQLTHETPDKNPGQRCLLLPLIIEEQGVGYTVIYLAEEFQPQPAQMEFMNNLARALSGLVNRTLTSETLRIRELELEEARADAIRSLGLASEYRDNETGWHIMRMTNYAQAIAKALGLSSEQRELLYITAPMHDVGKIGIADAVLLKPGKLTGEEFAVMKTHTQIGVTILTGNDALIAAAREIAGSHHEKWDGSGYPLGLQGDEIPLLARICAVADVFDALTSNRPYKKAWSVENAYEWVVSEAGKHFDPEIVAAFRVAMPEILRIRELYRDEIIDPKHTLTLPPIAPRKHAWMPWEESLSVGIDVIDEHHRYLIDLINDLHEVVTDKRGARQVARVVKALDAYAKVHFRSEEQMMEHCEYSGLQRQKQHHQAFEEKIREFYEELHANPLVAQFDVLEYMRNWLVNHIKVEDAQLRRLKEM